MMPEWLLGHASQLFYPSFFPPLYVKTWFLLMDSKSLRQYLFGDSKVRKLDEMTCP